MRANELGATNGNHGKLFMMIKISSRLVREPLIHFLMIGIAVFALYQWSGDPLSDVSSDTIVVTDLQVDQLRLEFEATWRRPPTEDELDNLVEDHIIEEIFVREARALGLDQNDAVIRRRLRQKMEFLSEVESDTVTPSDDVLRQHFKANIDTFTAPPKIAFAQIYLGETVSGEAIENLRQALDSGVDPRNLGVASLLPASVELSSVNAIDSLFGRGFFDDLVDRELGAWEGPIRSGYGFHLVRLSELRPAQTPDFDDVEAWVRDHWYQKRKAALTEQTVERLRERYEIRRLDRINEGQNS